MEKKMDKMFGQRIVLKGGYVFEITSPFREWLEKFVPRMVQACDMHEPIKENDMTTKKHEARRRLPDDARIPIPWPAPQGFFPITFLHRDDVGNSNLTDKQMMDLANRMERILRENGCWYDALSVAMEYLGTQRDRRSE